MVHGAHTLTWTTMSSESQPVSSEGKVSGPYLYPPRAERGFVVLCRFLCPPSEDTNVKQYVLGEGRPDTLSG